MLYVRLFERKKVHKVKGELYKSDSIIGETCCGLNIINEDDILLKKVKPLCKSCLRSK